ncbi:MAG: hypothetical protein HC927_08365 [Deltaproteobacteria bacterium]|nr:hypothetical protein [Deltaproteobacteria bacterium]
MTFPAHSLRLEASAVVAADGEALAEGRRLSAVYANSGPATATGTGDGRFALVDVAFRVGEHVIVLTTQDASFAPLE